MKYALNEQSLFSANAVTHSNIFKNKSHLGNSLFVSPIPRADLFEDEAVEHILKYNPWWTDRYSKMVASLGKNHEQENPDALGKTLEVTLICLLSPLLLNIQL